MANNNIIYKWAHPHNVSGPTRSVRLIIILYGGGPTRRSQISYIWAHLYPTRIISLGPSLIIYFSSSGPTRTLRLMSLWAGPYSTRNNDCIGWLPPVEITDIPQAEYRLERLNATIGGVVDEFILMMTICPHSKQWWTKDLT